MYQGLHDRQALRRVLVDDAEATPMYVLRDMAQATLTDTAAQDRLLRGLFDALHHQLQKQASTPALYTSHSNTQLASPHILYKALHALRVLCETGHPSVQSQLQRVAHTEVLRALTSFRGVPDAACGDAYNARVRSEANAVITAAFAPPRALPPSTTTASSQQQQHVSRSGSSNGDDHVTADTMMQRRGTAGSNSSGGSNAVLEQLAHVTRDALSLLTQHEALRAQQGGVGAHDYVYERAAQQQRGSGGKSNTTVMTSPLTNAGGRRGAAMMYTSGGTGSGFQPITLHTQTHGSNNSADTKQMATTSPLGGSVAAAAAATATSTKPTRTAYDVHDDSNDAYSADRNNNNNNSSSNSSGGEQSQQHAALARLVRTTTSAHASLSRVELSSFVHACHDRLMHEEQQQRQQQQHNNSDELLVAVGGNDDDPLAQLTTSYNTAATTTTMAQKDDASASHALCEALAGQLNMHVAWQQRLNALLCIEALLQSTLNSSNSSSMRDERAVVATRCAQCVRDYFVAHRDCVERLAHVAQATLRQRARALLARELGGIDDSDAHAERNTPHGDHDGAAAGGGSGSSCSPCASKTATPLSLRGMTVRRTAGRGGGGNSGVATTAVAPPHSAALVTPQTRQQQQPMLEALFAGDTTTHTQTVQQEQQQQQPYVSTEELFGSVLPAPATTAAPATMCLPHAAQQQTQEQRRQRRPSQAALAEAEALMRAQLSAQPLQHS